MFHSAASGVRMIIRSEEMAQACGSGLFETSSSRFSKAIH